MRQSVDNFIDSVHKLGAVEGGLMLLKHYAQNNDSGDLNSLYQSYDIIFSTNRKLLTIIGKCLRIDDVDLIKNFSSDISEISNNIDAVIDIINHIQANNIPGKSEMTEILQFCSANFAVDQFIKVFVAIGSNKPEFRQQIITLGDACENVF